MLFQKPSTPSTSAEAKMSKAYIEDAEVAKEEISDGSPSITPEQAIANKALVRKQDLRIVPLCAAIYLLCYLDRSNIGMGHFQKDRGRANCH